MFSSFFLCGLIWCVQLVHYPFFLRTAKAHFADHIRFHKIRISWIVVPVMVTELTSSAILAFRSETFTNWHIAGLSIVILIWLVTFLVQVPLHTKLSDGYNESTVKKLVHTNWIRTLLWTVKSLSSLFILYSLLPSPGQT